MATQSTTGGRDRLLSLYKQMAAYLQRDEDGSLPLIRLLLSGVVASVVGAVAARLLSMVATVLIARQLGVVLFGEYATLIANLALLASMLGLGLDTWILHEGGRNPQALAQNVWQVLVIKSIGAILLLGLLSLAWSSRISLSAAFVVGVFGVILDSFVQTGYAVLRSKRMNGRVALFQALSPLLLILVLWGMQGATPSVLLLFSVQAICSLVVVVVLMRMVARLIGEFRRTIDLKRVVRGSWLFVTADVCSNIYTQSGIAILAFAVSTTAVGLYRPAITLISSTFLIPYLLFAVGLPMISAPNLEEQRRRSLIYVMSIGSALYGVAVLIAFWFGSDLIISLFGPQYVEAAPFIQIMSPVPLLKAGSFVCIAVLIAYDQQKLRVLLQSLVVLLSIGGGLWLIPIYGLVGASWLYVAVETLLFLLYFFGALYVMRRARV